MRLIVMGLAFMAIAAFELPPLLKGERRGELITAGAIWLVALIYSSLQVLGLPWPDVNYPIRGFVGGR